MCEVYWKVSKLQLFCSILKSQLDEVFSKPTSASQIFGLNTRNKRLWQFDFPVLIFDTCFNLVDGFMVEAKNQMFKNRWGVLC